MFTVFDPGPTGVFAAMRGRFALFNEGVREIVDRRDVTLVDMWRMRDADLAAIMDTDRMHLNTYGHRDLARRVLDVLGVDHALDHVAATPRPLLGRRDQTVENLRWTREFLAPWIHRRLTGRSSGDTVSPKRPGLAPVD